MGRTKKVSEMPAYARSQVRLDRKMARIRGGLKAVADDVEEAVDDLEEISTTFYCDPKKEDSAKVGEIGAIQVMLQKIASMIRSVEREPD